MQVSSVKGFAMTDSKGEVMEKYKKQLSEGSKSKESSTLDFIKDKDLTDEDVVELLEIYFINKVRSSAELVLHMAVASKRSHAVEFLLEKFDYSINQSDKDGNSMAHILVNNEKGRFFQYLTTGYLFHTRMTDGDHVSTRISDNDVEQNENESATFVEWLMNKGLDLNRENSDDKTALQLSIKYNLQHISRVLLKYTQNVHHHLDQYNQSLLHVFLDKHSKYRDTYSGNDFKQRRYSAYSSRYTAACVTLLLDKGASPLAYDCWDRTPLYMAIMEGKDTIIAKIMIARLLEQDNVATTAFIELTKSCACWHPSQSEYFLHTLREFTDKGANVNFKAPNGATPLYYAFSGKNCGAVDFLNEHGADFGVLTGNDENLFHALAKEPDRLVFPNESPQEELFELLLLKKGCTGVRAKTRSGEDTPLHFATESGNAAITRKLIEHGAEVNCKNSSGETPLHLAVHGSSADVVAILLWKKAEVNGKDNSGRWPLYYAASSKNQMFVPMLLAWDAHVNVQIAGKTPLARAIQQDCPYNARAMLAHGANINDDFVLSLLPSMNDKCAELQTLLKQHWIKLSVAGLPASRKYVNIVKFEEHEEFYSECAKEVKKMRDTRINDHPSIYAFLHMNFAKRRALMNDKNFKALIIDSPKLRALFPKYKVVISASFCETVLWMSLVKPAEKAWLKLTGIRLPTECLEAIFAYSRNVDLLSIIKSGGNA